MNLSFLPELLAAVLASVIAITLHEAAHGYAALALGDDTAARLGRLSLNPLRHVDPVGTVMVPGLLLVSQLVATGQVDVMFGWAKPVPVDVRRLRDPRSGMMWVAAAGPAINFALAFLAALLLHVAGLVGSEWLLRFLGLSILANLILGLFNLFPVPPLDGGRIAVGLLPLPLARLWAGLERFGLFIVIGILFLLPMVFPAFRPMDWFVAQIVRPVFNFVLRAAGF